MIIKRTNSCFVFACIVFLFSIGYSQTAIEGDISATPFSPENNPYIVTKDIIVPENAIIQIPAGCTFLFKQFAGIIIKGRLEVLGSSDREVVFTTIDDSMYNVKAEQKAESFSWNGIKIGEKSNGAIFSHFKIAYSVYGIKSLTEALTIKDGLFNANGQAGFTVLDNLKETTDDVPFSWKPASDITVYSDTAIEPRLSEVINRMVLNLPLKRNPSVAVLPFDPVATKYGKGGQSIAEYIVSALGRVPSITIVENIRMRSVVAQGGHYQGGYSDDQKAAAAGRAMSVQYVVTGNVTNENQNDLINVRMVESQTSRVIAAAVTKLDKEKLALFSKEVLGEKLQITSTLFRSASIPGWGQFYTAHPVRGGLCLGGFLLGAGLTTISFVKYADKKQKFNDFTSSEINAEGQLIESWLRSGTTRSSPAFNQYAFNQWKKDRRSSLQDSYKAQLQTSYIALGLTGLVYVLNLADATVAGFQTRKKLQLYFSSTPNSGTVGGVAFNF